MNSLLFKQTNSWKELDDKMIAFVHLEKKGLEEHRDWMAKMEQRVNRETLGHKGRGVKKERKDCQELKETWDPEDQLD